jgi:hypothetical protein
MTTGSRLEVWRGTKDETRGGLTRADLFYDEKDGRIKSKARSEATKKSPALKKWVDAMEKAKKELGIKKRDFALVKGKLLKATKKIYTAKK